MPPILDLRQSAAFVLGHASASVNIPLTELASRMYELPEKGATLALFHDDPQQLARAMELLSNRGYQVSAITAPALTETGGSPQRLWHAAPILDEALAITSRPGRALDIACGSGREAVHLATLGWQVDAVDILPDALQNASALALHNGVSINTIQHDLRQNDLLTAGQYDLIIMLRYWNAPLMARLSGALASGGVLVVESFHPDDPHSRPGGHTVSTEGLAQEAGALKVKLLRVCPRNGRVFSQLIAVKEG